MGHEAAAVCLARISIPSEFGWILRPTRAIRQPIHCIVSAKIAVPGFSGIGFAVPIKTAIKRLGLKLATNAFVIEDSTSDAGG